MPPEVEDEAIVRARTDPNAFIEYCFTTEKGVSVRQAPHHREWQRLFGSCPALALLGAAEMGKTQQIAFRLTFNLGRNPERRFMLLGASQRGARKTLGVVKRAIELNPRVRRVFPDLRPGAKWTETELLVQRKRSETRDFSLQAYGWNSEILGDRADGIVADDICNLKNTRTEKSRQQIVEQLDSVVQSRLTEDGFLWVVGNAWHREDVVHVLQQRPGFAAHRTAVLTDAGKLVWPEAFSFRRLAKIRERMTAIAFARMYLCIPASDEDSRFEEQWFEDAKIAGLGLDWSPPHCPTWPDSLGGGDVFIISGVDLASGKRGRRRKTDKSSIFTIAFQSRSRRYLVLDVQTGRWKAPELLARMRRLARAYDPLFVVEDNGVQQMLVDIAAMEPQSERATHPRLRVTGATTTSQKWDPSTGIEGMALDFEHKRWIVPSWGELEVAPEVTEWFKGLSDFRPAEDVHTPDVVIASWIAWLAARKCGGNPFGVEHMMI